jgi:hypothetical protein
VTPRGKALLLKRSVEQAVARGTKHYDVHGRPLTTPREVLEALVRDGRIQFEPARRSESPR